MADRRNDWPEYAIWWQIYPLGFVGAPAEQSPSDGEVHHRFEQLIPWLDYAVELGCSGIQLGPIFESESHGYDTTDHLKIDRRLGDEADFDNFITACQSRGLHVLLDGVFNHVGRSFPKFQDAIAHGTDSDAAGWFHFDGVDEGGLPAPRAFEGHGNLVELNHDAPEVVEYVTAVMNYWGDRGISGWRLDAAYAMAPEFWRAAIDPVRERHPANWFVGEVIHGDYVGYVNESGLDSVTQYELWKALWSCLNDGNFYELAHAFERHNEFCESFLPLTFVGNHDVTRIASQLENIELLPIALAVLFTVPGTPSVYYGDEQAFRGIKEERFGGDDEIRPAFPAIPEDLASEGWPIYRLHQELIALRRRHSWLSGASLEVLILSNHQLAYRCFHEDDELVVVLNASAGDFTFELRGGVTVPAFGWKVLTGSNPVA